MGLSFPAPKFRNLETRHPDPVFVNRLNLRPDDGSLYAR
jgi:hypothetical protein